MATEPSTYKIQINVAAVMIAFGKFFFGFSISVT